MRRRIHERIETLKIGRYIGHILVKLDPFSPSKGCQRRADMTSHHHQPCIGLVSLNPRPEPAEKPFPCKIGWLPIERTNHSNHRIPWIWTSWPVGVKPCIDPQGYDLYSRFRADRPDSIGQWLGQRANSRKSPKQVPLGLPGSDGGQTVLERSGPYVSTVDGETVMDVDNGSVRCVNSQPSRPQLLTMQNVITQSHFRLQISLHLNAEVIGMRPPERFPFCGKTPSRRKWVTSEVKIGCGKQPSSFFGLVRIRGGSECRDPVASRTEAFQEDVVPAGGRITEGRWGVGKDQKNPLVAHCHSRTPRISRKASRVASFR